MMSKERELLKRIADANDVWCISEIRELLAQPEQTEQEPVAWKVIDGANGEFMFSRVKPMQRTYKYGAVIPLYSAPPKREPLGLEIMDVCGSEDYREGFKDGALYAEKCHGIGVNDDN